MTALLYPVRGVLLLAGLSLGLAACAARMPEPSPDVETARYVPARFAELSGWAEDDLDGALPALRRSCQLVVQRAPDSPVGRQARFGTAADWQPACAALLALGDPASATGLRALLEARFTPVLVLGSRGAEGLFTGYYEPLLRGSRTRHGPFQTPVHGRPEDLVMVDLGAFRNGLAGQRIAGRVIEGRLRPYEDRAAILASPAEDVAPVLAWVDDPIAAFFLQIQGSGRIDLVDAAGSDAGTLRLGYAAQNGHPYVAIGRELVAMGAMTLEEVSLQSIRAWLLAHPARADSVMNANPSYVFFREIEGEGPIGAQGVALTPLRSLAVDPRFVAYGIPLWLDAENPLGGRLNRLMVAQDTGGAIRGAVRGDVFWGAGPVAEDAAGRMRARGSYWLLVPKPVRDKLMQPAT